MSYTYKPHTWVPKEVISADKMNELEKAAEQVGKLKPVSETGSYNDLTDKPQINSHALSGNMTAEQLGFSDVAMSGSYSDLSGTPTNVSQFANDKKYQTESDVTTKIANANHLKRQVVTTLPEVTSADTNTIYMVKMSSGSTDDVYTEYMVIDGKWERLGTSRADLTEYMKTTAINAELAKKVSTTTTVNGHALSSNVTIVYADISDAPQPMTEAEIRAIFK